MPIAEPPPIQVLDDEQLRALLKACEGKDFYARRDTTIIRLFVATGLRVSELNRLGVADVDLTARIAAVKHPKGGKRTRIVRFERPPPPSTATSAPGLGTGLPPTRTCSSAGPAGCRPTAS